MKSVRLTPFVLAAMASFATTACKTPGPEFGPLCAYVDQQGMACPTLLGAESVYRPGSLVTAEVRKKNRETRTVVFPPQSYLVSPDCLLGGITRQLPPPTPQDYFNLAEFKYEVSRSVKIGATFPVPQVQGLTITAGPSASQVKRIGISSTRARFALLGDTWVQNVLADCGFRKTCVDRIRNGVDRVANSILIVEGLSYSFYDQRDLALNVSAAIQAGVLKVDGDFKSNSLTTTKLEATAPIIIGLGLVRTDVIQSTEVCTKAAVYSREGSTTTQVGGGGHKSMGVAEPQIRPFGESNSLTATGVESSECDSGHDRTQSSASASASVGPGSEDGEVLLSAAVSAHGGHWASVAVTFPTCIGWTGHDTSASATAIARARINALYRGTGPGRLRVSWSGPSSAIPAGIQVLSPAGQVLLERQAVSNDSFVVDIPDPGQYAVVSSLTASSSANGAAAGPSRSVAVTLKAQIEP